MGVIIHKSIQIHSGPHDLDVGKTVGNPKVDSAYHREAVRRTGQPSSWRRPKQGTRIER